MTPPPPQPQPVVLPAAIPTGRTTMLAIVQTAYGPPDVLRLSRAPLPVPAPDEVLVQVQAAGVDRGVWHLMVGRPWLLRPVFGWRGPRQRIPGQDLAGRVLALGKGVKQWQVGDAVFGIGQASYAQVARAKARHLARMPNGLTPEQAAAVPVSGLTALHALCRAGQVRAGHNVLVLGASGGVGCFAVQLAKIHGARVVATCSAHKAEFVGSLGADTVCEHSAAAQHAPPGGFDLILDIGGLWPVKRLRSLLQPQGALVLIGGEGGDALLGGLQRHFLPALQARFSRQRLHPFFLSLANGDDLHTLAAWLESGQLRVPLHRSYPLAEAPLALRQLAQGRVFGKLTLTLPRASAHTGANTSAWGL